MTLALLVFTLPFAVKAFEGPMPPESEAQENAMGVEGGAYEVTDYDMTAVVGKDHTYTV